MPEKVKMNWVLHGIVTKETWESMVKEEARIIPLLKEGALPESEIVRIQIMKSKLKE